MSLSIPTSPSTTTTVSQVTDGGSDAESTSTPVLLGDFQDGKVVVNV